LGHSRARRFHTQVGMCNDVLWAPRPHVAVAAPDSRTVRLTALTARNDKVAEVSSDHGSGNAL